MRARRRPETLLPAPLPVDAFPGTDAEVAAFFRDVLGLPGAIDLHTHFLPPALQQRVWAYFDRLDAPPWPIRYRLPERERLAVLDRLGIVRHPALAYPHASGLARDLNAHTLGLAGRHPAVVPTFTLYPEPEVEEYVDEALAAGGAVAKVHLQVGRFHATDRRLDGVWSELARRRVPVVLHASCVYGAPEAPEVCGAHHVAALLERHPDLTVVVAHLGAPDVADFVALAERAPGLLLDTAMVLTDPPFIGEVAPPLVERVAALSDRVVFGSDFPSIPHDYVAQVRGLARLGLDRAGYRAVFHDTAARLLAGAGV